MQTLLQDLRYGARTLRKNPSFTLIALITLALGIGANTVIFNFINAALLKPMPVREPGRLVDVYPTTKEGELSAFADRSARQFAISFISRHPGSPASRLGLLAFQKRTNRAPIT
jgi:hypothetical protein